MWSNKIKMKKIPIIEAIELGLNILAQDLIFERHTEKDLKDYINKFKVHKLQK